MNISIFCHADLCSKESALGVKKALKESFNTEIINIKNIKNKLSKSSLIVFPGGIGNSMDFFHMFEQNDALIKDYLNHGGKYLGICMGAYWAGKDYFNIAGQTTITQYIKHETSETKRPHPKAMDVIWNGQQEQMFFYDGPVIEGKNLKTIAEYPNDTTMAAIINNNVGLIGCHPESTKSWFDAYSWLNGKYHNGRHHELLLKFVQLLLKTNSNSHIF